jgi:hypothetical protein
MTKASGRSFKIETPPRYAYMAMDLAYSREDRKKDFPRAKRRRERTLAVADQHLGSADPQSQRTNSNPRKSHAVARTSDRWDTGSSADARDRAGCPADTASRRSRRPHTGGDRASPRFDSGHGRRATAGAREYSDPGEPLKRDTRTTNDSFRRHHSWRSATMGSTCVARRAGM